MYLIVQYSGLEIQEIVPVCEIETYFRFNVIL
jgi:hypothetical protein